MKGLKQAERKRVLVVDDDTLILEVMNDFLTSKGFDVTSAECGEDGLKRMAAINPDIILLDVNMPGIGGIGFLKRIMLSNGTLRYPVLVFTARTTTKDYFRGIPVDGFIAKPCDKAELEVKIQEILEKYKRAAIKTILLGEDDLMVAERLSRAFRGAGFEIEEAATGPEVLEKAAVCLPDVVLVKQILTGMNGDSVASILQAMPRTQSIPVILYDSSRMSGKEEETHLRHRTGIVKVLTTEDAGTLLKAVKEVV
jgi:CheY-like chemotaxis protein